MCRGYGLRLAETQSVELVTGNGRFQPLGLVDREPGRLAVPPRERRDVFVRRRQSLAAVHDDDCDIGLLERPHGLPDHAFLDADFAAGNAARVDDQVRHRPKLAVTVLAVTRQAGIVGD